MEDFRPMKRHIVLCLLLALVMIISAACTQATPKVVEVEKTVVVTQEVIKEVVTTVEVPKEVIKEVVVEVEKPAIPEDAKLTAWMQQSFVEGVDDFHRSQVKEFTKYTGIPVEVTYINGDDAAAKFNAALEAPNTLPDLIQFDGVWFPLFKEADRLVDVSEVVAAVNQDAGGINSALLTGVTVDGKQYAVPWMADAMATYIRMDLFEAAGLPIPTTYQELLEACPKINVPGEMSCVGLNINGYGDSEEFSRALIWSFGGAATDELGAVATINSPETIAALQYIKTLADQGSFPPDFAISDDYSNNQWFQTGLIAYTINSGSIGAWLSENDPEMYANTAMTIPLANEAGDRPMSINPMTLAITTNSKYPELAKKLLEWMTSAENSWDYIEATNYAHVSCYMDMVNRPVIQEDENRKAMAETMTHSRYASWPAPLSSASTEVYSSRVLSKMLVNVMAGAMTPEEAAADAEAKINEIIARYK
jgi:multiple sugar transport system substrate-binding protein